MISFTIASYKYKLFPYIVVSKLWLALEWYIPMLWLALHMFDVLALHVLDVALKQFSHIR